MESLHKALGRTGILAVVGMATVWTAVHNQLMYPVTFTYVKEGGPTAAVLYLVFAALELLACAGVFAARHRIEEGLFCRPARIATVGALGALGNVLTVLCDFSSSPSSLGVALGLALFSLYVPTYFVFWATRLAGLGDGTHGGGHTVTLAAIALYVLFCLFTAARLLLGIHASVVGPLYPLLGCVLAALVARDRTARDCPTGAFSLKQLPPNIAVPSLLFVYLCSLIITLLNPASSLSEYPPHREVLYLLDAVLFAFVACIYTRSPNALKRCSMQTFAVLSIYLVGAVLLVPHLISALLTSQGIFTPGEQIEAFPVVALIVVAAFLVSTTANVILIFFVARTPKDPADQAGGAARGVSAGTLEQVGSAWGLSAREADIVRMACTSASTAKIASALCIAESTVYTHLKRIYRKAGVHSRQELVDLVETFRK